MARKGGLGRGLGALIPAEQQEQAPRDERVPVTEVAISDVVPNPKQPRMVMAEDKLLELTDSILTYGIIQPLLVMEDTGHDGRPVYTLIAGERRLRAAKRAGLERVPVTIRQSTPQELLEIAIVENVQRHDLNPLEEAAAYQALVEEFGLTQDVVAARVGKSRVAVTNAMRLLRLPDRAKEAVIAGQIKEGHARALLGLPSDAIIEQALQLVIENELNVRQTEELVRRMSQQAAEPKADEPAGEEEASPETRELESRFRDALGTKVNLYRSRRGGRLVIHFFSEEELGAIYDVIVGGNESYT